MAGKEEALSKRCQETLQIKIHHTETANLCCPLDTWEKEYIGNVKNLLRYRNAKEIFESGS